MTDNTQPAQDASEESAHQARWNFAIFSAYFIILRVGWVAKLETVVVPMFVKALGGTEVVLGMLPVLSRLGNSLPQYVFSPRVGGAVHLKYMLAMTTLLIALPWLLLGGISLADFGWTPAVWIPLFLVLYGLFWCLNGMWLLTSGVLQGKLIEARRRGRLWAVSHIVAAMISIPILWFLLRGYFQQNLGAADFGPAFLMCGLQFLLGAGCVLLLDEPASPARFSARRLSAIIAASRQLIAEDRHFRRFVFVVLLMYMFLLLLPHYAPFGARNKDAIGGYLVIWIIVQNIGTGIGSLFLGFLADWWGNRFTLQILLAWIGVIPLVAVGLSTLGPERCLNLYWIIFFMLGWAPMGQRILVNYVLELAPADKHAQYLGTLNLWQMIPPLVSPLFGWCIQITSHELMFVFGSMVLLTSSWLAGRLIEPRMYRADG